MKRGEERICCFLPLAHILTLNLSSSAPVTSNQLNGGSTTTSSSSSVPSTISTGTGASPTSSSGASGGLGKVRDLFSGLGIFMGALWVV